MIYFNIINISIFDDHLIPNVSSIYCYETLLIPSYYQCCVASGVYLLTSLHSSDKEPSFDIYHKQS